MQVIFLVHPQCVTPTLTTNQIIVLYNTDIIYQTLVSPNELDYVATDEITKLTD